MPSAIGTDPDVDVWVEGEVRQQTMTVSVVAISKFAVIKMINPSRYIADFFGYFPVVRPSPLQIVLLAHSIELMSLYLMFKLTVHGVNH